MKRAIGLQPPRPFKSGIYKIPPRWKMIVKVRADIKQIFKLGKNLNGKNRTNVFTATNQPFGGTGLCSHFLMDLIRACT
jgi:hypothetical protein